MGGTTAKAGVIYEGNVLMTGSALIGGYATGLPVQMPMIDIQEVGTGGGSIARIEVGNALRVGPESAGAAPGPVCYGLGGTEPTITDANLMLGRLGADRFLGGEMKLDLDAAKKALTEKIAKPLGLDPIEAAEGILRIATTKMAHVVRWVTTERGLDAADFALVAYGGAGPAARVGRGARAPRSASSSSPRATGTLLRLRHAGRRSAPRFSSTPGSPPAGRRILFRKWKRFSPRSSGRAAKNRRPAARRSRASRCGAPPTCVYVGQEHAVTVELPIDLFTSQDRDGIKKLFDAVHQTRYGFSVAGEKGRDRQPARRPSSARCEKPPFEHIAKGNAEPDLRGVPRQAAGLFRQQRLCRNADL